MDPNNIDNNSYTTRYYKTKLSLLTILILLSVVYISSRIIDWSKELSKDIVISDQKSSITYNPGSNLDETEIRNRQSISEGNHSSGLSESEIKSRQILLNN